MSEDGKQRERESAGVREAKKLYRRRSAHLSLSPRKVKARVEITEFGLFETSRARAHFLWAAEPDGPGKFQPAKDSEDARCRQRCA